MRQSSTFLIIQTINTVCEAIKKRKEKRKEINCVPTLGHFSFFLLILFLLIEKLPSKGGKK